MQRPAKSSHITVHLARPASPPSTDSPARPAEGGGTTLRVRFRHFASWISTAAGSHWAFIGAVIFLALWALSYPLFLRTRDPFDAWQLVVNTITTIITFLMVFLIQNAQNRDARAIHLKLDELIRAQKGARNDLVELEDCSDEELAELKREFERIHHAALTKAQASAEGRPKNQGDSGRPSPARSDGA